MTITFPCLFLFLCLLNFAQESPEKHEEHARHIGFLLGSVYNVHEEKWMLGIHLGFGF